MMAVGVNLEFLQKKEHIGRSNHTMHVIHSANAKHKISSGVWNYLSKGNFEEISF